MFSYPSDKICQLFISTLLLFSFVILNTECKMCELQKNFLNISKLSLNQTYTCPTSTDPSDYTECCGEIIPKCCPQETKHSFLNFIDERYIMILGLSVIITCLTLTFVFVICCFWSRCPLYNTCRSTYSQGTSIAYSKEEDPLTGMPSEDKNGANHYSPQKIKIKIKHVDEV